MDKGEEKNREGFEADMIEDELSEEEIDQVAGGRKPSGSSMEKGWKMITSK